MEPLAGEESAARPEGRLVRAVIYPTSTVRLIAHLADIERSHMPIERKIAHLVALRDILERSASTNIKSRQAIARLLNAFVSSRYML